MQMYFTSTASLLGTLWCIGQVHGFVVPTTIRQQQTTKTATRMLSAEAQEEEMMMNRGRRHVGLRGDDWNDMDVRPRGGPMQRYERPQPMEFPYSNRNNRAGFYSDNQNRWYDSMHSNSHGGGGWDGGPGMQPGSSILQGQGSRAFWSPRGPQTLVSLGSGYRNTPVSANVEYWQGPGNVAQKVKTWTMDGALRPFQGEFETSGRNRHNGGVSFPGTMHIRNTGPMEFPASVSVQGLAGSNAHVDGPALNLPPGRMSPVENIDGGALRTFTVDASVDCVRVHIRSEGGPIQALVEVWQGPGQSMQVADVYADDGLDKPFTTMIQTPGYGTTLAVRNVGPMTFPIKVQIEKFSDPARRGPDHRFNPSGFDARLREQGFSPPAFGPRSRGGAGRRGMGGIGGGILPSDFSYFNGDSKGYFRGGAGRGYGQGRFNNNPTAGFGVDAGFYSGRNDSRRGAYNNNKGRKSGAAGAANGQTAPFPSSSSTSSPDLQYQIPDKKVEYTI
jgi:hypothetical protein